MEQWERDYLDAIQSRHQKKASLNGYTKEQKEYINACWEEIIRPDGSKWYVPNQEQIKKQQKKAWRKKRFTSVFKKIVSLILALILGFSLLSGVLLSSYLLFTQ